MFPTRLNYLLTELKANNVEIAKLAGFDRTNISHLRSGKRAANPSGAAVQKLISGIYLFAEKHGCLDRLREITGAKPDSSAEDYCASIHDYLFEGTEVSSPSDSDPKRPSSRKPRTPRYRSFAQRLDICMNLAELSNIRLSQLIYTDASLISRYRNGVRTPRTNHELAGRLCAVLYERILRNDRKAELAKVMNFPEEEVDEDFFTSWLFEPKNQRTETLAAAENLLGYFDSYSAGKQPALPSPAQAAPDELLRDCRTQYSGKEGLRTAVLRFLGSALAEGAREFLLYSDEAQDWLTEDPVFLMKWASLMQACVKNGTRITIIHNIDRNLNEMNQAIQSWLPLYMSGNIESYYCRKQSSLRFSHTIFLNPDSACIRAFHIAGTEDHGIYHYYTDPEILKSCKQEYQELLSGCASLLKTDDFRLDEKFTNITLILDTLPFVTMPDELIRKLGSPSLEEEWSRMHADFLKRLEEGSLNVCVPLADEEQLFSENAHVDSFLFPDSFHYTSELYALHIRHIIYLINEYPNFCFYPLPETPFPNMKLLITDDFSRIIHSANPKVSFGFTHPLMSRAFKEYAKNLMDQHATDRSALCQMLEQRYLSDHI